MVLKFRPVGFTSHGIALYNKLQLGTKVYILPHKHSRSSNKICRHHTDAIIHCVQLLWIPHCTNYYLIDFIGI